MHKGGRSKGPSSSPPSSLSADGSASFSSGFEDVRSVDDGKGTGKGEKGCYRFQLAKEAQELLANIAELELIVLKLEEEMAALHFRLRHERTERHLSETINLDYLPSLPLEPPSSISGFMWKEHISSLRASKFGGGQMSPSLQLDLSSANENSQTVTVDGLSEYFPRIEVSYEISNQNEQVASLPQSESKDPKKIFLSTPNKLSEEMVRCMRGIFLCLSESTTLSKLSSSESLLLSSSSPVGHLSQSSFTSCSDSSMIHSSTCTPIESNHNCREMDIETTLF